MKLDHIASRIDRIVLACGDLPSDEITALAFAALAMSFAETHASVYALLTNPRALERLHTKIRNGGLLSTDK